jgi:hypothetical protein
MQEKTERAWGGKFADICEIIPNHEQTTRKILKGSEAARALVISNAHKPEGLCACAIRHQVFPTRQLRQSGQSNFPFGATGTEDASLHTKCIQKGPEGG